MHEDAKVVAEVGSRDAEGVHGGENERRAGDEEGDGSVVVPGLGEVGPGWLRIQGDAVSVIHIE